MEKNLNLHVHGSSSSSSSCCAVNAAALKMPFLGIGTFEGFDPDSKSLTTSEAVSLALEVGYRHIDCAFAHNNEVEIGKAISYGLENLNIPRNEIFVTSKLWNEYHKTEDVEAACRKSLSNLGLQNLDLYLMHWPFAFERQHPKGIYPVDFTYQFQYDTKTHFTETWLAMEKLVDKGLVKAIGVSNFNEEQIKTLINNCHIKPVVNQIECHPYLSQDPLVAFCKDNNIQVTAYSPLGCKDRLWKSEEDMSLLEHPKLIQVAENYDKTVAQLLLKWQIQREIAVVPRMRTASHIWENFRLMDWSLSSNDMKDISGLNKDNRLYLPLIEGRPWCSDHPHYPFETPSI